MFNFSLKYFTVTLVTGLQKEATFFSALCVIFASFAVKKLSVFCWKSVLTYLF